MGCQATGEDLFTCKAFWMATHRDHGLQCASENYGLSDGNGVSIIRWKKTSNCTDIIYPCDGKAVDRGTAFLGTDHVRMNISLDRLIDQLSKSDRATSDSQCKTVPR